METKTYNIDGDNITVTLRQDAYIANHPIYGDCYMASAYNADNEPVSVIWDIVDSESDDQGNACDWANPTAICRF